jgi:F-box-like
MSEVAIRYSEGEVSLTDSLHSYACVVKMSLFSYKPANQLPDDVLLVIFDQLEDQDLLRCEIVCRQWRNFLLSGRPWRRLFNRQIVSSPRWRRMFRDFGMEEKNLETLNYRALCKAIIQELNKIENNWRTGNYKISTNEFYSGSISRVVIGKDWIAKLYCNGLTGHVEKITIHSRTSMVVECCIVIPLGSFAVTNAKIVVLWDEKNLKILGNNGRLISEVPELNEDELISWNLATCCISGDHMAVISQSEGLKQLSLWDMSDPFRVNRLNSRRFRLGLPFGCEPSMKLDDQFIAVLRFQGMTTKFYFFAKETLGLHWQKTVNGNMKDKFVYDKGMLLLYVEGVGLIEMYDVASRQCFRKIGIVFSRNLEQKVGFNSKFMVVADSATKLRNAKFSQCQLKIYDLEAVKDLKSTKNDLLVRTVTMKFQTDGIVMDETLLICYDWNTIHLLDFGSFEHFQNAANSVTLSSPWRSVWRSKGVDEEPLKPVLHMKVYKEVLKYFHELSMNCRKAIMKYLVEKVDPATFILGDDFIGCRRYNPDIVTFDENMNKRCQEISSKTVRISKNTFVSVMGKTILLIDNTTGQVTKDERLDRVPIGWHVNCNLLVCVHKMAEHEHLLSVWRVANSSNFNHIKDVTIEDYDGSLHVDDNFIAVETAVRGRAGTKTYNFISMKTFQVERSVSSRANYFAYDKSYLFLQNKNRVRILDVASGTFLRDIHVDQPDLMICSANSNYVVILSGNDFYSKLNVYDLECLKETDAVPSHLLLTTIGIEHNVHKMLMNETRIVCLYLPYGYCEMYVVDLKPIDRLRFPEYNE